MPGNRRVAIQRRAPVVVVAEGIESVGRAVFGVVRVLAKLLVLISLLLAVIGGGRFAISQVVASPHFSLAAVEVVGEERASADEILALTGVAEGDRLLALDTDALAARITEHPWVAEARVSRRLPATLLIDVVERRAQAAVNLGGLYLIDEAGRPFKRATAAEAVGLPVITGIERSQYVDHRQSCEAAFREALTIVATWRARPGRPALSEINIAPRHGFTAFLAKGGAEIRLGRKEYEQKLARLDQILEAALSMGAGAEAVRVVHLDGSSKSRIPVDLATTALPSSSLDSPAPNPPAPR